MANQWFRMYSEFATDPKVQMLSEANQRRLTMLFCFRCNSDVTLQDEEVTFMLRISNEEWAETKSLFIAKGFINSDNEILNWDKRQFASDTSKNRVAKYRENKKLEKSYTCENNNNDVTHSNGDVTLQKQKSNAIDTEQNRTDTEQIQKGEDCNSEETSKKQPRQISKKYGLVAKALVDAGLQNLNQSNPTFIALVDAGATPQEFVDVLQELKSKNKKIDFNYIVGVVSGRRKDAKELNLHQGAMPASNYQQGITIAANSVFKDRYIAEQTNSTMEIKHEQPAQLTA